MQIYLVGGAVRDALLGLPVKDRDWVVVGATVEQMLAKGFRQVGRDFPVFLHPKTQEEYALARTERKRGMGYKGFVVHADPSVTLEQDLIRRDLTINAIAQDDAGQLIDPFDGQRDIEARVLRHVSPAFVEDPLRVLRVARFAARFAHLGFTVADETLALMRELSRSGELEALTPERVWQEMEGALKAPSPQVFISVLRECEALPHLLPELAALFTIEQPDLFQPQTNAGQRTLEVLQRAAALSEDTSVRFAALVHDIGRGTGDDGAALVEAIAQRLRLPNEQRELGVMVCRFQERVHRALSDSPEERFHTLELTDALRRAQRFEQFLVACQASALGRSDLDSNAYTQAAQLRHDLAAARAVDVQAVLKNSNTKGPEVAPLIRAARIAAIADASN